MIWNLHGIQIAGQANDGGLWERWRLSFDALPAGTSPADLWFELNLGDNVPMAPAGDAQFRQGELLAYYLAGDKVTAHFPRFGQLQLDLAAGRTTGQIVPAALESYGVFEDLLAIGLSPHLRRRGLFFIHAFAAAHTGRAVLIVGGIGAGKTTTGLALLDAGWQLLSNDSPLLAGSGRVHSYPGVLAAYPESFARFPSTAHLAGQPITTTGRQKVIVPAGQLWPNVWVPQAPIAAILFPQIEPITNHTLEQLTPLDALRRLLPHAIEQWDKAMIPNHLALLRQLVESAPAYILHLAPDVLAIPPLLHQQLQF